MMRFLQVPVSRGATNRRSKRSPSGIGADRLTRQNPTAIQRDQGPPNKRLVGQGDALSHFFPMAKADSPQRPKRPQPNPRNERLSRNGELDVRKVE